MNKVFVRLPSEKELKRIEELE